MVAWKNATTKFFSAMKRILCLFAVLSFAYSVLAVPAYPKRIRVVEGRDTVLITLKGDERCKYALDEEGYGLLQTADGWRYATKASGGKVVASSFALSSVKKRTAELSLFLSGQEKGLLPYAKTADMLKAQGRKAVGARVRPVVGERKVLVIMMQFADRKFTKGNDDFQRLFNEENYREDNAVGSVRDYYDYASYGKLRLRCDIVGPYTSAFPMRFYGGNSGAGGNDQNPYALFEEAVNQAANEVNLSDYDADGDGFVDNIHIVYAGYGEEAGASSDAIWAHKMSFVAITVQGMKIDTYSCAPELRDNMGDGISRIGPHCHEIGHALGAMDYYDTNYETGGSYQGTGQWDIMASGSWNNSGISPANFNPYAKVYDFGWAEAKALDANAVNTIAPSSYEDNIYRIDTGEDDDFYLLENRRRHSFDKSVPGEGLLVFHIGPNIKAKSLTNTINATYPQQCYPVCASSQYATTGAAAKYYGDINSSGCPFPGTSGNGAFTDDSTPAACTFQGSRSGISLTDIMEDGESVSFYNGSETVTPPDEPDVPGGQDGNVLWHDDFEGMELSSFWSYADVVGQADVVVMHKLTSDDTPKSPCAASGYGFLEYSPQTQVSLQREGTSGRLSGGNISVSNGKRYLLQLKARKFAHFDESRDTLFVNVCHGSAGVQSVAVPITRQEEWQVVSVPFVALSANLSLSFDVVADYKSDIFLDDMKIVEDVEANGVKNTVVGNRSCLVYDLSGRPSTMRSPGIKIVWQNGRAVKKIVVR